jgi:hypothetical protein
MERETRLELATSSLEATVSYSTSTSPWGRHWIAIFVVLSSGSDLAVGTPYPNGSPVEKTETVVAERPDANDRRN